MAVGDGPLHPGHPPPDVVVGVDTQTPLWHVCPEGQPQELPQHPDEPGQEQSEEQLEHVSSVSHMVFGHVTFPYSIVILITRENAIGANRKNRSSSSKNLVTIYFQLV